MWKWLCVGGVVVGWGLPEQSALLWVTLFNSAHTSRCSHTLTAAHSQRREARRHTTWTCKHTQVSSPWGRGHILSLVLINEYKPQTRKVSVCCSCSLVYTGFLLCSMIMCFAYGIYQPPCMSSGIHYTIYIAVIISYENHHSYDNVGRSVLRKWVLLWFTLYYLAGYNKSKKMLSWAN